MRNDNDDRPELSPIKKVGAAVAVFYVAALLLNAEGLLRNAERMTYGRQREVCVAITRPVATLAGGLGVTRLRSGIERLMMKTTEGKIQ